MRLLQYSARQDWKGIVDITNLVSELKNELHRIERAIAALEGLTSSPRRGRPPKSTSVGRKPRRMSAAARKRISQAMKQRWAKWGGKSAPKKAAPKRKPMSTAMRKKLSAMMKARWAARSKVKTA
jgi:hypothetical protein